MFFLKQHIKGFSAKNFESPPVSRWSVAEANTVNCSTQRRAAASANYSRLPVLKTSTGFHAASGLVWTSDWNGLLISTRGMSKIKTLYEVCLNVLHSEHATRTAWLHICTCHYLLSNTWTLTAKRFSMQCYAFLCGTPGTRSRPGERHISLTSKSSPSHYCGPWDLGIIHRAGLRCLYMSNLENQAARLQSWSHTMACH